MPPPDLVLQTTYAELLERTEAAAFADAFPEAEAGTFTPKTVRGARYWYFQTGTDEGRVQRYVGKETPELLERIARHRDARHDERERRALVSTLVRSFGMPRPPDPEIGDLIAALARAGVFRLRGVLVGTVAYQTYSAMLGVRLSSATLQTGDIDIAQYRNVSLAVADRIPPAIDVLRSVNSSFQAVPHIGENNKNVSYRAKNGLRVDFLTPNEGADNDAPQPLPALQTDAQPLRFLDFLIHDPVPAVLLHGPGIYVHVPSPDRYAIHKLIVARRRKESTKSDKDLRQAESLLETLSQKRPHELAEAWHDAFRRGEKWRKALAEGLSLIAPVARDGLLKIIGWRREQVPDLKLSFPNPRPRYDFDRDVVVFMGEDRGGAMRCAISREALEDHFDADGLDQNGRVDCYRKRSSLFESLARSKYRNWPIEEPGVILLRTEEIPDLLAKADRPAHTSPQR